MAQALARRLDEGALKNVMILTNSISSAELLAPHCSVVLTGGKLRPERMDVAGFHSEQMVKRARFDRCFIGVDGIDLQEGLMAFDGDTSNLDRLVIEQSDEACILADSSKFYKTYLTAYERISKKHRIITDAGLNPETLAGCADAGIIIEIV